jgi:hypothetical protein
MQAGFLNKSDAEPEENSGYKVLGHFELSEADDGRKRFLPAEGNKLVDWQALSHWTQSLEAAGAL